MESINVADLPEPVARAVASLVESLRQIVSGPPLEKKETGREFPRWEGRVLGNLSREELYDDVV